jgi:hypothetical protein
MITSNFLNVFEVNGVVLERIDIIQRSYKLLNSLHEEQGTLFNSQNLKDTYWDNKEKVHLYCNKIIEESLNCSELVMNRIMKKKNRKLI